MKGFAATRVGVVAFLPVVLLAPFGRAHSAVVPLADVVPDYMEDELETAVIPTPQRAEWEPTAFAVGKVVVVKPDRYHAPDTLFEELKSLLAEGSVTVVSVSGFAATEADTIVFVGRLPDQDAWNSLVASRRWQPWLDEAAGKGSDAYVLCTAAKGLRGKNVVLLAGNAPAADFWALATLRQMIFSAHGVNYVREGRVLDFPRFEYRGNKRPQQWEWRYKANYAWFFRQSEFPGGTPLEDYHRTAAAWIHYGNPLQATDEEMDRLVAGFDDPETKRHAVGAKQCHEQGCREFVLKFDDTGWQLSGPTAEKFGGDPSRAYFKALNYFLVGMHRRIKAIDRENRVFFMPRPYWHNSFEQRQFAASLLAYGPLPKEMGLSVCGPEVISWTIPTACLRDFRRLYGLEEKAQIYDNFGRGGEYFACTGREADLWTEVACLFPERGTPLTRITVLDYLWNPEAYDPARSLKLAIRELSGRDPRLYRAMWRYVSYYNEHRDPAAYSPREAIVAQLPEINRNMKARFDALVPLLPASRLAEETRLKYEFWGPEAPAGSYEWGEYARLRRRLQFAPYMTAYGYREAEVAPAAGPIVIDGKLDEAAWRVPCIELLFDVSGRREHYYHVVSNMAHLWIATHCRAYATEKTGGWWRPDWKFRFTLGEKSGIFEASIPLADLTQTMPQKGTVWGFQAFRSGFGPLSLFSGSYDRVGGEHGSREFGRIVFG